MPIRLIYDRWVSKYAEPWAAGLTELKERLESPMGSETRESKTMERVFEIYIRTTPEKLWEAITDADIREKYMFGARFESAAWREVGAAMTMSSSTGLLGEGEILEVDPPRKLVHSMHALWGDDVAAEGFSRVTWEIEQVADSCRLLLTHDQLREGGRTISCTAVGR